MGTIQLIASLAQLAMAIAFLVMVRSRRRARSGYTATHWALVAAERKATRGHLGPTGFHLVPTGFHLRYIHPDEAQALADAGTIVCETERSDAGECKGMGAFLGGVRLYRTAEDSYLVRSELWLSSLPPRTSQTLWSGWATKAEGIRAFYTALDDWYGRDTELTWWLGGPSAHEAPIDRGHDLVAVHAALAADRDLTDLDLTVGSLPARILHAAHDAGYDDREVAGLDLTDEDLLPALSVAAALNA